MADGSSIRSDPAAVRRLEITEEASSSDKRQSKEKNDVQQQQLDHSSDEKPSEDIPPEGGYGWVCVICAACINANTWGVNSSYGVFLSYYLTNDIFSNASPIEYAFTGGLSMSCCLLIAPLVTHMVHLYGNRAVLNVGVLLQTFSFIGASFATEKWHIFLSQGVCFGWGMGLIFIASVSIIPQWFRRKRSIANSFAAAGSGIGGLAYSLGAGAMLPRLGLGWTFRVLGLCSFAINLVASNLMRDRNKAIGSRYRAFHFPLLKRPEFLLLQAWGVLSLLGYVVLLFSLPNFALSIGLSAHQGSIVGALLNLGQALGRPVVGLVSDRFGRFNMATALSIACGVFILAVWIPSLNMGVLCFFAIMAGTVAGTFWTTIVPICAEVVGMQELPGGLSITWVLMVPPTTVAEPIAVLLKNDSRSDWIYLYAQIFTGIAYVAAGISLWFVRGWKIGDNERIAKMNALATITGGGDGAALKGTRNNEDTVTPALDDSANEVAATGENLIARDQNDPENLCSSSSKSTGANVRIWAPAPLLRRMMTWTNV